MHNLGGRDSDLEGVDLLLLALERDFDRFRLLSGADLGTIEIILIHLEKFVVFVVDVVKSPLQSLAFSQGGIKSKRTRSGDGLIKDEVASFPYVPVAFVSPGRG